MCVTAKRERHGECVTWILADPPAVSRPILGPIVAERLETGGITPFPRRKPEKTAGGGERKPLRSESQSLSVK
jgi:hypothetical protein